MSSVRKAKTGKGKKLFGLTVVLCGMLVLLFAVDGRIRPLVKMVAESRATSVATRLINEAVSQQIEKYGLDYSSITVVERTSEGNVSSVRTDMALLNDFKAQVVSAVQDTIDDYEVQTISLPIGTIIGGDYFSGRGPAITFRLQMSCSCIGNILDSFDDAGINQTRHQITLQLATNVYAVVPWFKTATSIQTDFVLADTVIVGQVPNYYTHVQGSDDVMGDINDYGAEPQG